jgi:parallel beta-helix repeat protein
MAARTTTSLACTVLILALTAGQMPAAILQVDPNDPNAYSGIQEAIDAAYDFDVIEVHPGVYEEQVNYNGAMVTVRSLDPNDPAVIENTIIDCGGTGAAVVFRNSEGACSVLEGLTIRNAQNGIQCVGVDTCPLISKCRVVSNAVAGIICSGASPTIMKSTIEDNKTAGISGSFGETSFCRISGNGSGKDGDGGLANCGGPVHDCVISNNNGNGVHDWATTRSVNVKNCIISGNLGSGLYFLAAPGGTISNCTVVGNNADGAYFFTRANSGWTFDIRNCIIVLNRWRGIYYSPYYYDWWKIRVDYSNVWGNIDRNYGAPFSGIEIGPSQITEDPFFAKRGYWDTSMVWHEGDYHLKSTLGRWDPRTASWVIDPIDSPCLDRGDPADGFGDEPYPHGGRINQGAYGGTAEASKSEGPTPMCTRYPEMDFNGDCKVDQADLDIFLEHWLECNLDPQDACWPDGVPSAPVMPSVQP